MFFQLSVVDSYFPVLAIVGLVLLGMAWMPALTRLIRISYSIIYVGLGMALYAVFDFLPEADPLEFTGYSVRATELMVIVSLMSTGLKIDEPFSVRKWRIPLRLVSITMLLSIASVTLIAYYWLGLGLPASILLGAVLAPTDPVLADDVQVGPPLEKKKNDVRFSLTAEAGLNDGMAFPFTWLAIAIALYGADGATLLKWAGYDVAYRIGMGLFCGFIVGRIAAYLIFDLPHRRSFIQTRDGFVALSLTLLVYGATELLHGYGFVAVFVCAITLRNHEIEHDYHVQLHSFTDQVERMLMAIVLIVFGGSVIEHVFRHFSWEYAVFAVVVVLLVRPLSASMSLFRSRLHLEEKSAIAFFGIKGIGSLFYLAFAFSHATFEHKEELWALTSGVVLCSLVAHGFSANSAMKTIERKFPKQRKVKKQKSGS